MTDRPLRLAFVGQSTFFEACVLEPGVDPRLEPRFHEFRGGGDATALLASLERFDPDVILVFRPEIIPAGAFAPLRATTVGFLTEPLPRTSNGNAAAHEDLERRLWELGQVDASNYDRIVAFDPLIAETADRLLPIWRAVPIPVSDRYFRPVAAPDPASPPLFVGRSTEHRERLLTPSKHRFDVLHLAFGVDAARLQRLMGEHWRAINAHNEPYPSFENRVCLHLAAGHLVLSEALSPSHGLEPDIDFLEFRGADHLERLLAALQRDATLWHAVRVRGRRKAEQFRASRVYPRIVSDLLADLRAFGSPR
ncbi:MAG TPA: hypothetical protein VF257_02740 [Solirubrobacteraceae bacterium]